MDSNSKDNLMAEMFENITDKWLLVRNKCIRMLKRSKITKV